MKKFKKILTTLCVMVMVCFLALPFAACDKKKNPTPPNPPAPPEQETKYYENDPNATKISNYQELVAFIDDITENDKILSDFGANENGYVVITNDIDCGGNVLKPIVTNDEYGITFKIDGDGHKIKNFKLDDTCKFEVQTRAGTALPSFKTLALFPVFEGGTLENIEFADFQIEGNFTASERNDVYVGIVGYARTSGANSGEVTSHHPCTFKNIKITNADIDVKSEGNSNASGGTYPLTIGALIGIDSDTTNTGDHLNETALLATRENITVTGLDVTVNKTGTGAMFLGGAFGQVHWMIGEYKNIYTQGTVTVTSTGTTTGTGRITNAVAEVVDLGDSMVLGGIIGAEVKNNHQIKVNGGKADIDFVVNANENLVFAGNAVGLYANNAPEEGHLHEFTVDNTFVSACTIKYNDGDAVKVTDVIRTPAAE